MENALKTLSGSWKQGLISPDLLELKWFTVCLNTNPTKIEKYSILGCFGSHEALLHDFFLFFI